MEKTMLMSVGLIVILSVFLLDKVLEKRQVGYATRKKTQFISGSVVLAILAYQTIVLINSLLQ